MFVFSLHFLSLCLFVCQTGSKSIFVIGIYLPVTVLLFNLRYFFIINNNTVYIILVFRLFFLTLTTSCVMFLYVLETFCQIHFRFLTSDF